MSEQQKFQSIVCISQRVEQSTSNIFTFVTFNCNSMKRAGSEINLRTCVTQLAAAGSDSPTNHILKSGPTQAYKAQWWVRGTPIYE